MDNYEVKNYGEEPKKMNVLQKVIGIFISPMETFKSLNEKQDVWTPLIIIPILGFINIFLTWPFIKEATEKATLNMYKAKGIEITTDQMEKILNIQKISTFIMTPITIIVMLLITTVIIYLAFKFVKGNKGFSKYLSVVGYSMIISVVGGLILAIVAKVTGLYDMYLPITSLASLLDPTMSNTLIGNLLAQFDLFNIWYFVLLCIGMSVISGVKKEKAYTVVFIIFILGLLFVVGSSYLTQLTLAKQGL